LAIASAKAKEVQPNTQADTVAPHLLLPNRTRTLRTYSKRNLLINIREDILITIMKLIHLHIVTKTIKIDSKGIERLRLAVQTKDNVQGLTHNYYRYPARFSPKFVHEVIELFSEKGDVILDPFVGGGTTLVEALASNRHSIGFDVSPIASFVAQTKTTLLSENDLQIISKWADFVLQKRIVGVKSTMTFYEDEGYLNNLPWTIKRSVKIILADIEFLKTEKQQRFAKCILLKTAQWAIDCRKSTPTAKHFRDKFSYNLKIFSNGIRELTTAIAKHSKDNSLPQCICINNSSDTINACAELNLLPSKPKLVITSPPYIGVHMLYHQWQVNSRKRTRTPFWIINSLDGQGSAFYTFGHYQSHAKKTYFEIAEKVFTSIHSAIHDDGIVVQLVGFSDHKIFLKKYLEMMNAAGYEEIPIIIDKLNRIKRIWRNVPNRKWYNNTKNELSSSKEVLLIHRKK